MEGSMNMNTMNMNNNSKGGGRGGGGNRLSFGSTIERDPNAASGGVLGSIFSPTNDNNVNGNGGDDARLPPPPPPRDRLSRTNNNTPASAVIGGGDTPKTTTNNNNNNNNNTVLELGSGIEAILSLLSTLGSAYCMLSQYKSSQSLKVIRRVSQSQFETGWCQHHVGRAYFELANYPKARVSLNLMLQFEPYRLKGLELLSTVLWHLKQEVSGSEPILN